MNKSKTFISNFSIAALSGIALTLSQPGFDLWPLAFAGAALLFRAFDRVRALYASFIAGFIYCLFGMTWLRVPMTVFGGAPIFAGWLLVFFAGLVGGALFFAPAGLVYDKTKSPTLTALVFVALETLKSRFFFGGLPWINLGQSQYNNPPLLQLTSIAGELFLSFAILITGYYLYATVKRAFAEKRIALTRELRVLISLLIALFGVGFLRLLFFNPAEADGREYTARVIQTGVRQELKWESSEREEVVRSLMTGISAVFREGEGREYDLMILPESTFPANPFQRGDIRALLSDISVTRPVIIGYSRGEFYEDKTERKIRLFNSAALLRDGSPEAVYDKRKLAPFGEYFPLAKLTKPIREYFFGNGLDYSPGEKEKLFSVDGLKLAVSICFEGAFSELIREKKALGANALTVISNDAWFGDSAGRVQNLAINRVRAAEYGLFIVRVTQDGISGLIAPDGSLAERLPENIFYYKDITFKALDGQTIFFKTGYLWYVLALLIYTVFTIRKKKATNL